MKHLILINFKTYEEAIGKRGVSLAKELAKVKPRKYTIAVAPSLLDLKEISALSASGIQVYSQHADPFGAGAHTGHILPQQLKELGVAGTILNHSERKRPFTVIKNTVQECRRLNLKTIVCVSRISDLKLFARLNPDYMAYEPPVLIGGEVSVSSARPKIISKAVRILRKRAPHTGLVVGAGVHSREDVRRALELGAVGVLIGHAVARAREPAKALRELLR